MVLSIYQRTRRFSLKIGKTLKQFNNRIDRWISSRKDIHLCYFAKPQILKKVCGFSFTQKQKGGYFYILIDRANEDKETAVHFLNQVDDADLQALLEDGEAAPETCTCTTKCEAGAVNTNCPVCKTNMTECTGPEPQPQEPEETEPPQEKEAKSTGMGGLLVFLVVALMGGGAALYFFKFRKPKADTKGGDELDEYDFGEDEDDEDEPTPEDEEPAQEKEDKE